MYLLSTLRWLVSYLAFWFRALLSHHRDTVFRRKPKAASETAEPPALKRFWKTRPKREWVRREVLRLKALMPENGCRKIAATFCYLHSTHAESVSKSFVAKLLKEEAEAILRLRQELKNRVPKKVPNNLIWALDLTFLSTPAGANRSYLGVIDHGSRACLTLRELTSRRTVDILRVLMELSWTASESTLGDAQFDDPVTAHPTGMTLWPEGGSDLCQSSFAGSTS